MVDMTNEEIKQTLELGNLLFPGEAERLVVQAVASGEAEPLLYVDEQFAKEWVLVPRDLLRRIVDADENALADGQGWLWLAELVATARQLGVKEETT